jgi:hypothetical protein
MTSQTYAPQRGAMHQSIVNIVSRTRVYSTKSGDLRVVEELIYSGSSFLQGRAKREPYFSTGCCSGSRVPYGSLRPSWHDKTLA